MDEIVSVIRDFANEIYKEKVSKNLLLGKNSFPKEAIMYNSNI
ncbi:MAG: hypothetical protein PHD02_01280 [Bacilli bacterium]|nr:hypothetical protein [Bacilli bacterium]